MPEHIIDYYNQIAEDLREEFGNEIFWKPKTVRTDEDEQRFVEEEEWKYQMLDGEYDYPVYGGETW